MEVPGRLLVNIGEEKTVADDDIGGRGGGEFRVSAETTKGTGTETAAAAAAAVAVADDSTEEEVSSAEVAVRCAFREMREE